MQPCHSAGSSVLRELRTLTPVLKCPDAHHAPGERSCPRRRRVTRRLAADGLARRSRSHRHEVRLRRRILRRVYGARRPAAGQILSAESGAPAGQGHHDDRGTRAERAAPSSSGRVPQTRSAAVRLLHARHDHGRRRAAGVESASDRRRDRQGDGQERVPVRHVSKDAAGGRA